MSIHKIKSAEAIGGLKLLIVFDNDVSKEIDLSAITLTDQYRKLSNPAIFRNLKVDPGGHGISWSDDMDISEHMLWQMATS